MRVCLTVQGEQPIMRATSLIPSGGPSGVPDVQGTARGSRGNGPGWGGQWGGQCCTPLGVENARKRVGLRVRGTRAFGAEAGVFEFEFGSLMSMIVSFGSANQS